MNMNDLPHFRPYYAPPKDLYGFEAKQNVTSMEVDELAYFLEE